MSLTEATAEKVSVNPAAFPPATPGKPVATVPLSRFYDVRVRISAELGRIQMPLGELLNLGPGAVLELDRSVNAPLDILAQGVRIAGGEVVVVHDRYGIRITELDSSGLPQATGDHTSTRGEK